MDYKTFKGLPPLDQLISSSGIDPQEPASLKHLMALINLVARGATGDTEQKFIDETIDMIFNGEPEKQEEINGNK